MASLEDVMLLLGRVQEGVERLRDDFQDEKKSAADSRAVIHRRLDEQVAELSRVKGDIIISAQVDAQVREEIKSLKKTVDANHAEVQPSIDEWKRMKVLGVGLVGLLAIGGLSVGAVLMWMGEVAASAVRHWLRIG